MWIRSEGFIAFLYLASWNIDSVHDTAFTFINNHHDLMFSDAGTKMIASR